MLIDLIELTTVSIYLATLSSREIVRYSAHTTRGKTSIKSDGSQVTSADYRSQRIICGGLRDRFGSESRIRIVGEEDGGMERREEPDVPPGVPPDVSPDISPGVPPDGMSTSDDLNYIDFSSIWDEKELYREIESDVRTKFDTNSNSSSTAIRQHVEESDISIFIDPLDGTKHFCSGEWDQVTTLIGITEKNCPVVGICAKPFDTVDNGNLKEVGAAYTLFGGPLLNGSYLLGGSHHSIDGPGRLALMTKRKRSIVSERGISSAINKKLQEDLKSGEFLTGEPMVCGGAGAKLLKLLFGDDGEVLWPFPMDGTSLWDVCAAQAIVTAVGGVLTDADGNEINYLDSSRNYKNCEGVMASLCPRVHSQAISSIKRIKAEESGGGESTMKITK